MFAWLCVSSYSASNMEDLIIEKVKKHEILYDIKSPNYRDQNMRQEAWTEIGKELKIKAETAKNTWDKLRRCFINAINRRRSTKNGQEPKKIPPWKYEQQMSFLLPFMDSRKKFGDITEEVPQEEHIYVDSDEEPEKSASETSGNVQQLESDEPEEIVPDKIEKNSHRLKRKKRKSRENSSQEFGFTKKAKHCDRKIRDLDDTDMFFISLSRMTKKLPTLEQSKIKLQLCNSVLQAQIKISEEQRRQEQAHPI